MYKYDVLTWYPKYMQDIEEVKCIADIEERFLSKMKTEKNSMLNDITMSALPIDGNDKWEVILGGYENNAVSYISKIEAIKWKINQAKIVTMDSIREYLDWILGEGKSTVEYDDESFVLSVNLINANERTRVNVYNRLREYVPCNILLSVNR